MLQEVGYLQVTVYWIVCIIKIQFLHMYMPLMLMCLGMWLLFIQDSAHSTGGV